MQQQKNKHIYAATAADTETERELMESRLCNMEKTNIDKFAWWDAGKRKRRGDVLFLIFKCYFLTTQAVPGFEQINSQSPKLFKGK